MKAILLLLILVFFGPAFGQEKDIPAGGAAVAEPPPPVLAPVPPITTNDQVTSYRIQQDGPQPTTIDITTARGEAAAKVLENLGEIQRNYERHNISLGTYLAMDDVDLQQIIDRQADARARLERLTYMQSRITDHAPYRPRDATVGEYLKMDGSKLETSIAAIEAERVVQRRNLVELPLNIVFVAIRTYLSYQAYIIISPDTPRGYIEMATMVAALSNLKWLKPDSWYKFQMKTLRWLYNRLDIPISEMNEHSRLNLSSKMTVNVTYGLLVSEVMGRIVGMPGWAIWTLVAGNIPNATMNETVDHISYGGKNPLLTRDQQKAANFIRQVAFQTFFIPLIQHGNWPIRITAITLGAVAWVGYFHAHKMVEAVSPYAGPVARPLWRYVLKPAGDGVGIAFNYLGNAFANLTERTSASIEARHTEFLENRRNQMCRLRF